MTKKEIITKIKKLIEKEKGKHEKYSFIFPTKPFRVRYVVEDNLHRYHTIKLWWNRNSNNFNMQFLHDNTVSITFTNDNMIQIPRGILELLLKATKNHAYESPKEFY